jgi:hypothetical protein
MLFVDKVYRRRVNESLYKFDVTDNIIFGKFGSINLDILKYISRKNKKNKEIYIQSDGFLYGKDPIVAKVSYYKGIIQNKLAMRYGIKYNIMDLVKFGCSVNCFIDHISIQHIKNCKDPKIIKFLKEQYPNDF